MAYQKFNNGRMAAIVTSNTVGNNIPPPGVLNTAADGTGTNTVTVSGGVITAVVLDTTKVGSGYATPPKVTIAGTAGSGALLTAVLNASGAIGSITVDNGGSSYSGTYTITISGGTFNYAQPCLLYNITSGDIKFETSGGDIISLLAVPAFTLLPINVVRVYTAGTTVTAGNIYGIW